MITSCICHGCPRAQLELDGKLTYEHYATWAAGKDRGATGLHDPLTPNGGGAITFSQYAKYP